MQIYNSKEAAEYFSKNRNKLEDFYKSEQAILHEFVSDISKEIDTHTILDIGCATGGLGRALKDKLDNKINYIGVDINPLSIQKGRILNNDLTLIEGDFSKKIIDLSNEKVDTIISFSCIDWNDDFDQSIKLIKDFCHINKTDFIFTFRASKHGLNNSSQSYQYVNYKNIKEGEIATYVVLSYKHLKETIKSFNPSSVNIYAYKRAPSSVAVTPYKELIFGCVRLKGCGRNSEVNDIDIAGKLPLELIL